MVKFNKECASIQYSRAQIRPTFLAISLRAPKTKAQKRMKYDWNKLKLDTALQAQFNIEVHNRYEILQTEHPNQDIQTKYDNFEQAIHRVHSDQFSR